MPAKVIEKSYNSKVLKYKFETSFPALLRFYSQDVSGRADLNVKTDNIPLENVYYRIPLYNSMLLKIVFVNKYYPCGKFEIYGV